jgi:hypothetical protein
MDAKAEDVCESCIHCKKRNIENCQIQQKLHTNDIVNKTTSIIIKCEKYKMKTITKDKIK